MKSSTKKKLLIGGALLAVAGVYAAKKSTEVIPAVSEAEVKAEIGQAVAGFLQQQKNSAGKAGRILRDQLKVMLAWQEKNGWPLKQQNPQAFRYVKKNTVNQMLEDIKAV
jgi:hypothetical protein